MNNYLAKKYVVQACYSDLGYLWLIRPYICEQLF